MSPRKNAMQSFQEKKYIHICIYCTSPKTCHQMMWILLCGMWLLILLPLVPMFPLHQLQHGEWIRFLQPHSPYFTLPAAGTSRISRRVFSFVSLSTISRPLPPPALAENDYVFLRVHCDHTPLISSKQQLEQVEIQGACSRIHPYHPSADPSQHPLPK